MIRMRRQHREDRSSRKKDMINAATESLRSSLSPEILAMLSTVKIVIRVVLILGATGVVAVLAMAIRVLVIPIESMLHKKWSRRLMDEVVVHTWVEAVIGGWCIPGSDLRLSGELPRPDHKAAVIIMNHQLDTDWLYAWEMLRVVKGGAGLKIMLLDDMRSVPILGKAMELAGFLFVRRGNTKSSTQIQKESDYSTIKQGTKSLASSGRPSTLLIFPEGTTVNAETITKANDYAQKVQRPSCSLLVVPRAAGLVACLRGFEDAGLRLDADVIVYDTTLAYAGYSGEVPRWELGFDRETDTELPNVAKLIKGKPGAFVRIDATAHRASDILLPKSAATTPDMIDPNDRRRAEQWLDKAWSRKEQLLDSFATTGDFPDTLGPVVDVPPTRRIVPLLFVTGVWSWALACAALALCLAGLLLVPVLAFGTFCFTILAALALPIIGCAFLAFLPFAAFAYTLHLAYRFAARAHGWNGGQSYGQRSSVYSMLEPPCFRNALAGIGRRSRANDSFHGVDTDDADAFQDDLSSSDNDDEIVVARPIVVDTSEEEQSGLHADANLHRRLHNAASTKEEEVGI